MQQASKEILDALRKGMAACFHPDLRGGEITLVTRDGQVIERVFSFDEGDDFEWLPKKDEGK